MSSNRRLEPGTGMEGDFPVASPREWTFMVYLAGDNNLEDFGRKDLMEIKQVGSTDKVAIVAQFDRMQEGATRRYYLRKGGTLEEDEMQEIGETNTGDPRELVLFVNWAMSAYPAKHYALVLWNHGSGWKEDDVYRVAREVGVFPAGYDLDRSSLVHGFVGRRDRPSLFSSTLGAVFTRGIAYDDSSADFLDNSEMKRALGCSLLTSGVDKLALLGFDACLMNMLEVAYQIKDVAEYVVGSQETEPGEGWPYGNVLQGLLDEPSMGGEELSSVVVQEYMASYGLGASITQSALDLSKTSQLVVTLNEMCKYILDHLDDCELIIGRASRRAQKYSDPDYVDLYDFCRLVHERSDDLPDLQQKAQAVMDLLMPAVSGQFVCAEDHRGARMSRSHGVSVYFPGHEISPFYKRLDFASESLWDDVLHQLFGV